MDIKIYLEKILKLINEISKKSKENKFYAQIANALRIYYLGINNLYITGRILKQTNFSLHRLNNDEKSHIENAGWLLDKNYVETVYLPALKTNLILDLWLCLSGNKKNKDKDFYDAFSTLVESINNDSILSNNLTIYLSNKNSIIAKKGQKIDFITPENVLALAETTFEKN